MPTSPSFPYRLGLPAWAFPGWRNVYFDAEPSVLNSYASVFNAVEGNTTFYHIPSHSNVASWLEALQGTDCKISFKLPSAVTHQRQPDERILIQFLETINPLRDHLGPFLLQFPQWVGMEFFRRFVQGLDRVADMGTAVVEVRNPELFSHPEQLEPMLNHYGFGRAVLDCQSLYQGDLSHPEVVAAVHEKPDLPVLPRVYNDKAFVRLMLHPDGRNEFWIERWATQTAQWIAEGIEPIIMIHCPNNFHCPLFAEQFHLSLQQKVSYPLASLPAWPIPQQGSLI